MSFDSVLFKPYAQSSARIIPYGVNTLNFPHAVSPLAAGEDYIFGGSTNCQTVSSMSSPVVYGGLLSESSTAAYTTSEPITTTSASTASTATAATSTATVTASPFGPTSSPSVTGARNRIKLPGIQSLPVVLTLACLTFIRSEMYRHDQHNVISLTTQFFSFDELKHARKILYEKFEPNKKHPFRCPTDSDQASHCTASIILKFNEIENKGSEITVACPAEDLFRVTQIRNSSSFSLEKRVLQLEKEMKEVKSAAALKPPGTAPQARKPPPAYTSRAREDLISDVSRNVPYGSSSPSVKRNRSTSDDDWETATNKKNGVRPQSKKPRQSYWGNNAETQAASELTGADLFEVFLCNYKNIATNAVVREHFKDKHNISVLSVRERSRPDAEVKSFVMRLARREDFDKVISVLPYQTGARWYDRGFNQQRKPLIFNNTSSSAEFLLRKPTAANTVHSTPAQRLIDNRVPAATSNSSAAADIFYSPAAVSSSDPPAANTASISPGSAVMNAEVHPGAAPGLNFRVGGPVSLPLVDISVSTANIV